MFPSTLPHFPVIVKQKSPRDAHVFRTAPEVYPTFNLIIVCNITAIHHTTFVNVICERNGLRIHTECDTIVSNQGSWSFNAEFVKMKEIVFEVNRDPDGGYTAEALGYDIFTQSETWDELRTNIREATAGYFFDDPEINNETL